MKEKILALEKKHGPIQINCKGNDSLPLDIILDFQGNLKKRSKTNLLKLIGRIFKLGFIAPFFIWDKKGDYFCFDGHGRIEALSAIREAGVEIPGLFPVVYIQAETDEQAREILLSISSQYGEFDEDELAEWIDGLDDEIAESLRLVDQEIALSMPEEETEGDDELPDDPEPVTKLGDLWELGGHRLLCGDSTDQAAVERLMDGKKADMVFTDPPYGVNVKGGAKSNKTIAGDLTQVAIPFSFDLAVQIATKDRARLYFCGGEGNLSLYDKLFDRFLNQLPRHLIWVKNGFVMKPNNYHNQYEIIYFGYKEKGGGLSNWFSGRGEDEASDVWKINRDPSSSYSHPTQKPVALAERAIKNSSSKASILYEPFLGSGSTLIACEKTNRICYGMELDPHYCDVIVNRYSVWCEENNRQPVIKLNGKPYSL